MRMTNDRTTPETVRPEFSTDEAEALLKYTETCLQADDSFDEMRENLVSACDELNRALNPDK